MGSGSPAAFDVEAEASGPSRPPVAWAPGNATRVAAVATDDHPAKLADEANDGKNRGLSTCAARGGDSSGGVTCVAASRPRASTAASKGQ